MTIRISGSWARARFGALTAGALVTWTAGAMAQDEAEEVPAQAGAPAAEATTEEATFPPRKMDVSVPDPGPSTGRKGYMHEGFYLRVGVGPAWQWTSLNDGGPSDLDLEGNAFAFGGDLLIGGSPSPGITLGGGVVTNFVFNLELETPSGERQGGTTTVHFIVGPFFDAFPNNKGGWHLGGLAGFATTTLEDVGPNVITSANGFGAAVWAGHDWWVAPEWSAGLNLRLSGAWMWGDRGEAETRDSSIGAALLVNVLYN